MTKCEVCGSQRTEWRFTSKFPYGESVCRCGHSWPSEQLMLDVPGAGVLPSKWNPLHTLRANSERRIMTTND